MNELREISTLLFIINLITMIAVIISLGIAPAITRKSLLFGVRIPEDGANSEEVIQLKKKYVKLIVIAGIIAIAILIVQYILWPDVSLLAVLYLPLLLVAVQFVVFVSLWKRAVVLKAKNNWKVPMTATVDTSSAVQRERIWAFSKVWYGVSILITLALIGLSLIKYPSLPEQIATHWGFDMQPDAWSDKTIWTVFMLPLISLGTVIAMMIGNITVYRMKLQVSAEHPKLSYAQHCIYRRMMTTAIGITTLMMAMLFGFLQLMAIEVYIPTTPIMTIVTILMIIACCVPVTYVYLKAGQGGCKLRPAIEEEDVPKNNTETESVMKFNRGDDRFWKLGMFYYNEDDPAMLVEDRLGMNTGFNYAHTTSKVVTFLLIIMTAAVYIGTTIMFFKI